MTHFPNLARGGSFSRWLGSRLPLRRTPATTMNHDEQYCDSVNQMLRGEFSSQRVHDGRNEVNTGKNASTDLQCARPDEQQRSYPLYRCVRAEMKILVGR